MGHVRESGASQVLQLLSLFSDKGRHSFTALREQLDMAAPTLSRHLRTLQDAGWVSRLAEGDYAPGEALLVLAESLRAHVSAVDMAAPLVRELAELTGESAAFVQWSRGGFVFRAKQEMPDSYHYIGIGERNAGVLWHAFGMLSLSFQPPAIIANVLEKNIKSIDDPDEFSSKLVHIAAQGWIYGIDKGIRIGAAVFRDGVFCGVAGISMLPRELPEVDRDKMIGQVRQAAAKLTSQLSSSK